MCVELIWHSSNIIFGVEVHRLTLVLCSVTATEFETDFYKRSFYLVCALLRNK